MKDITGHSHTAATDAAVPRDETAWPDRLSATSRAPLYCCRYAAANFGVAPEALLLQAANIVDPGWFLRGKARTADRCRYF